MEEKTLFDFLDMEHERPKAATDWKWTFSDYPKEKNGLKVFSCFSCGGGSTMGYKLAGCDVLGCCEIDPQMMDAYKANHNPKYSFLMDIRNFNELDNKDIPGELFDLDILDGSPPCTTFSTSGPGKESWGKKKKFREGQAEQTLDDLPFVFIETAEKLKPKVVIMENVEGLLRGDAWAYVQKIYSDFSDAGYFVHHWLLKGETMGIPQKRHRVFFVACRSDLQIDPSWFDMYFNYEKVTMQDIKGGTPRKMKEGSQQLEMLKLARPGDHQIEDVLLREKGRGGCFNDLITWYNEVPPTLTAKGNIMIGDDVRKVSDLEVIRMQTFPEDYDFCGFHPRYICGMSVPPVMMKRLVKKLIENGLFDYKLKADS